MRRNLKRSDGNGPRDHSRNSQEWEVIKTLVNGDTDPSRFLELYYWTREPGLVELIRAYLDLPERTQRNLGDYLLNTKPRLIQSSIDPQGRLVLSRSDVPMREKADKQRQATER